VTQDRGDGIVGQDADLDRAQAGRVGGHWQGRPS
jgi:hypothetical protein